jgi:hypothetical protein
LDCLGRRRSPAATSAFHAGGPPGNRGLRYPADPPPVEEVIAVIRAAGDDAYGDRLRGMMVVLWRAGLRIGEALALAETDLDPGVRRAAAGLTGSGSAWLRSGGVPGSDAGFGVLLARLQRSRSRWRHDGTNNQGEPECLVRP